MPKIANRKHEFGVFEKMLHKNAAKRILLIEGPSERGKSTLLEALSIFATERLGDRCCACTDLKGGMTLVDLFARFRSEIGDEVLVAYSRLNRSTTLEVNVAADLSGAEFRDGNTVSVNPIVSSSSIQLSRHLGETVVQDLHACKRPIVLIIDTYEQATSEAQNWIVRNLLPVVRHNSNVRIVIAGKDVVDPSEHKLTWGSFAEYCELTPVTSVDDWHDYAKQFHPAFPREDLEKLCKRGLTEYPVALCTFIENTVRELPPHDQNRMVAQ